MSSSVFIHQFFYIHVKFLFYKSIRLYYCQISFLYANSVIFMSSYVHNFIYQEGLVTRFLSTEKKSGYEQLINMGLEELARRILHNVNGDNGEISSNSVQNGHNSVQEELNQRFSLPRNPRDAGNVNPGPAHGVAETFNPI